MRMTQNTKLWLVMACAILAAQALAGQQNTGAGATPAPFYEELIRSPIIPQRSPEAIQEDLNTVADDLKKVDRAIADAQARTKEAEGWLTKNKAEIDAVKAKINAAKKDKRDADKVSLEARQKELELVDEYLKKTKETRDAELDLAQAQKDLLQGELKAFRAEDQLREKVNAIKAAGPNDPRVTKIVLDAAASGESTLKFMKAVADKNEDVAGRAKRLADRRIDLATARNKLLSEDRIRSATASMSK